ncbi:MAG: PilT/PilU family type 4a pilus ATPase [Candidatus Marinimicrobia bacterium]|nr:PilT/PilU family type 4a pilus ATPase [Candidatus Neomarinimicrobiota bacterium]
MNFSDLLKMMVDKDATDLYISVGSPPMYRIGKNIYPISSTKLSPAVTEKIALSFLDDAQAQEFSEQKEIDIAYSVPGVGRVRINIYRQRGSVGMVLRHIKSEILTMDELDLPSIINKLCNTQRGLILVTGATGSGKSTTLAAMIDHINSARSGHIVSIEDPMEFLHYHKKCIVTQREVGMDTDSYQRALKSALRQTPDVLLIGEIRDQETMKAALTFAETGHLVFSTLHSVNANQTLERIMNFFPVDNHPMIRQHMSLNLKAILSQRLVTRSTGKGMIAAMEILINTARISDLIHKGDIDGIKSAIAAARQSGLQTFDQHLFDLYQNGTIKLEDALAAADSANDLKLRIKMDGASEEQSGKHAVMTDAISFKDD